MIYIYLLLAEFLALVVQEYLPGLPYGAHLFLLALVFFYGAMAVPFPGMLVLAFAAGFMWDAFAATQVVNGSLEIPLGWSIVMFAILGAILNGFRPLFQRGHGWEIHCLLSGPLIGIFVLSEFLMITFRRGGFIFPKIIWWRIGAESLSAMIAAPIVFLFLHWLALSFGLIPPREEREAAMMQP
jgi:hypothetical protein